MSWKACPHLLCIQDGISDTNVRLTIEKVAENVLFLQLIIQFFWIERRNRYATRISSYHDKDGLANEK